MPKLKNISGQVAIYSGDNKQLAISNSIDFTGGGTYTFSVTSTNDSELYTIRIFANDKDEKYQEIKFDCKTGDSYVQHTYDIISKFTQTSSSSGS